MINKGAIWKVLLALGVGLGIGYGVIPEALVPVGYVIICLACLVYAMQNNLNKLFTFLPFAIYAEVFIRANARAIPYLMMQYLYVAIFSILLINNLKGKTPHTKAFALLIGFGLIEVVNGFFPDRPQLLRAVFFNSFSLILAVIWASFNKLSSATINKILANVKIASVFLAGIIIVAHLKGKISYGNFSSSDASNGLAPVQISGYLGFASSMWFISALSPQEGKNRLINVLALLFVSIVMVLTFSRGGLYFLGAIVTMYLFFNRVSLGNYFKYLMLIPIVILIFNFVVEETGGAIVKRYEAKGSSNRDVLVEAGFSLFLENPVFGVGTSNYGTAIVKSKLFSQESTAHNEFARAMSEHGIFGIFTYWGFFIATFFMIAKRKEPNRQFSIYFLSLFCFITIHNGLKISVQQLLVVLAIANPTNIKMIMSRKVFKNVIKPIQTLQQSA